MRNSFKERGVAKSAVLWLFMVFALTLSFNLVACSGEDGKDGVAGIAGADGKDGVDGQNGKDGVDGKNGKDGKDGKNGKDGKDGKNGKDAVVNVDSIAAIIRKDLTKSLLDSMKANPNVDTVYKTIFDSAYTQAWLDSAFLALNDSLKGIDFDSLYLDLYDSVYSDVYTNSVIRSLFAEDDGIDNDNIYGAFANQYAVMYSDLYLDDEDEGTSDTIQSRFPFKIVNDCDPSAKGCNAKKVMLKTWITGFTDTVTITGVANPSEPLILNPVFKFDDNALNSVTSTKKTQRVIEAYALENDQKILFYSLSRPLTIHSMQIYGDDEIIFSLLGRDYSWYAAWVTPSADSITAMVDEIAEKLPNKTLLVYQKYAEDKTVEESVDRVVKAVYEVLASRGIKYIENIGAASFGQRVNYPVETLRKKQGICIETVTLVASVLERLGLRPVLAFVPEHVIVGWYTTYTGDKMDFLESTMLRDESFTYENAKESAAQTYKENVEAGNFESGDAVIVDIKALRLMGIMPNNIP